MEDSVGSVNWKACETCRHFPPEAVDCDINAPSDMDNFSFYLGHVVCLRFESAESESTEAEP